MKKIFTLLFLLAAAHLSFSQCTPDTSITDPGIYPDSATGLADGYVGVPYTEVIQVRTPPDTIVYIGGNPFVVQIDTITLVNVIGLPPGINYPLCNPPGCAFPGWPTGTNGCGLLSGTPTTAGVYPLVLVTLTQATLQGFPLIQIDSVYDYHIGISAMPGFSEIATDEKNNLVVHPNPASAGLVNCIFYAEKIMETTLEAFDVSGRMVLNELITTQKGENTVSVDVKILPAGAYSVKINLDERIISGNFILVD